jgi:hypothetical protein
MDAGVAVVVVFLFSHVDGVERIVGDPGVGDASTLAAPRSWFLGLTRDSGRLSSRERCEDFFRAKAQRFGTNGGDACGCRIPLEGVVVVILPALWLRVKTLDLAVSMAGALCVVTLLRALSRSPDTTRYRFSVFIVLVFCFFFFFMFDLLCTRFSSPPCIGSAVGCYIIYSGA